MAVDPAWRLYYDPDTVAAWTTAETGSVLVHEVLHVLRDHSGRASAAGVGEEAAGVWNLAADAEINDDLGEARLPLPGQPVLPATLGAPPGRLAEEYFARLRSGRRRGPRAGECGSGAHGVGRPFELPAGPAGGISPGDASVIRREVALSIAGAAAGRPGSVPGGLARWADAMLKPRVDWRCELGSLVRRSAAQVSGRVDYSYRRRSRRAAALSGVVLPGFVRPVPEVAVVVDTSASMDAADLGRCLAEVEDIIAAAGLRARRVAVLSVDTDVQSAGRVGRAGQVRLQGGGGTDMGAGIAAAASLRPRPQVVVVLTDGETPWPSGPPAGTTVIVGLIMRAGAGGCRRDPPPPWARTVHIEAAA
jgi:predicted metal-dependent peptidase